MYDDHVYLYVEDEALSREVMQVVLQEGLGVQNLVIFEDSYDFITRVEALDPRPDIIMLDVQLRPLDGFEMLALLRTHPDFKEARIVAVTASVMSDEITRLKDAGFNGVIAKPVRISSFPAVLLRLLQGEQVWNVGN